MYYIKEWYESDFYRSLWGEYITISFSIDSAKKTLAKSIKKYTNSLLKNPPRLEKWIDWWKEKFAEASNIFIKKLLSWEDCLLELDCGSELKIKWENISCDLQVNGKDDERYLFYCSSIDIVVLWESF
jgi:hypothetical protein